MQPTHKRGKPRGQAAFDYLIAYCVVFLIIAISITLLYRLFSAPQSAIPNTCIFSGGVTCGYISINTNSITGNTAIVLVMHNAETGYLQSPSVIVNTQGVNTTSSYCLPSYVKAGGSIICVINLTSKTPIGQALSGTNYLSVQNCAFATSGNCKNAQTQVYAGKFYATAAYAAGFGLSIALTAATNTPLANNQKDLLTATLTFSGRPLSGATINFTQNITAYQINPKYTSTDTSGSASSSIWGTTAGKVKVFANLSNTISANMILNFANSGPIPYVHVTLSNAQNTPTGANFQQMITFNPASYSPYEANDLGNIRFYSGTAPANYINELYSWCESGCTPGSASSVFWVNLPSGIAEDSNVIINMTFQPTSSTEYDGVYAGEAPTLSPSYAQYDNGNTVFTNYWNFAGTNLPNGWTSSGTVTVNNGITIPASQTAYAVTTSSSSQNANVILEYIGTLSQISSGDQNIGFQDGQTATGHGVNGAAQVEWEAWYGQYSGYPRPNLCAADIGCGTESDLHPPAYSIYYIRWTSQTTAAFTYNYGSEYTETESSITTATEPILIAQENSNQAIGPFYVTRTRAYPPNGVMPGVSFGSIGGVPKTTTTTIISTTTTTIPYLPITLYNNQGTSTGPNFQDMISYSSSNIVLFPYEANDLGNIRFYQGTSELYSWCESGCTTISSSSVFWINLPSGIDANSNVVVNMTFLPTDTEYDGVYAGEAPAQSSSYAQYDNGASVFNFYDGFAGGVLSNQWVTGTGSNGIITVNNGATVASNGLSQTVIQTVNPIVTPHSVVESYSKVTSALGIGGNNLGMGIVDANENTNTNGYLNFYATSGSSPVMNTYYREGTGWVNQLMGYSSYSNGAFYILGTLRSGQSITPELNYITYATGTGTFSPTANLYLIMNRLWIEPTTDTGSVLYQWVRTRAYPPGGVMPSTSYGSIT